MIYIRQTEPQSTWLVTKVTTIEDKILYLQDREYVYSDSMAVSSHGVRHEVASVEHVHKFIFQARMEFVRDRGGFTGGMLFRDVVDPQQYYTFSTGTTGMFIQALQNGWIRIQQDHFTGLFTFVKRGTLIFTLPEMRNG